ncbi:TIGR03943 family putative permease subunit [Streptomyces rishiriensis]|uniref:Repeat protein (TIGR03943 family) n=1 Tax=Streptomyces rishiriensis TaxID=68264 RepID=A0ABU0NU71_STRRH|nr:TIGR03943 family protein [Streptomyces rishiriensis]MDQ0582671.1 putative repeat protein (TIGR03943 family) [Streptomyces rishiriensis]
MRRFAQVGLLVLGGLGLLHTSLFTDEYLRYVKEGMRPLLIASGVLLVVLGVAEAWASPPNGERGHDERGHGGQGYGRAESGERGHGAQGRGEPGPGRGQRHEGHGGHESRGEQHAGQEGQEGHGHDHSAVPRIAWLLFLPVLSLLFYAPPALGSYTASREPAKAVAVQEDAFDPLPATSPLPITLTDFTQRVQQDRSRAIRGRAVVMTGFVSPAPGKRDGWYLTRIVVNCCAADASSVKVLVTGVAAPKADTWVNVTGTWRESGALGTSSAAVALDARAVQKVRKPLNAYMDALPLPS